MHRPVLRQGAIWFELLTKSMSDSFSTTTTSAWAACMKARLVQPRGRAKIGSLGLYILKRGKRVVVLPQQGMSSTLRS